MDHTTTVAALAGALVLAALHVLPDVAFVLQLAAVGTFVGTTIAYLRGADSDQRFAITYRWTLLVAAIGLAMSIGSWLGVL